MGVFKTTALSTVKDTVCAKLEVSVHCEVDPDTSERCADYPVDSLNAELATVVVKTSCEITLEKLSSPIPCSVKEGGE